VQPYDAIVIGAGVIGLAIGRKLVRSGLRTLVLDGEPTFGTWTSSRNSEVIHAGIYYAEGSLKERLCSRGRDMLYAYCLEKGVPHSRIGKLIFAATPDQSSALDKIMARARAANVDDLVRLQGSEVASLEAVLGCHEAILSPSTGIIDSHAYMLALLGELESGDGLFVPRSSVQRLSRKGNSWGVHLRGDDAPSAVAQYVVNAAGLTAHLLALETEDFPQAMVPDVRYARGVYFNYGKVPFSHLIYPVPVPGGLGTHLTLDMAGMARFGPDVEWIDRIDYSVDRDRRAAFIAAARLIWPDLDPARMVPGYAGVRPKLSGPGEPPADFLIVGPESHALSGLVNLFGIESPGLTASLAIADLVAAKLGVGT
jgi:L-2-hydroxyglutarate oxidase LhgO